MSQPRPHQFSVEGLPDGDYTFTVVDGVGSWGAAGASLSDAVVTVVGGIPMLVFDDDSTLVTTEAPE